MSSSREVKIIGVPVDLGSSPLGVDIGPAAIRHAGLAAALEHNKIAFKDHGDLSIRKRATEGAPVDEIARVSEELAGIVSQAIQGGQVPVVLGGDHSASIGSIAGASRQAKKLGLLWLDCHPDANTPETSPSGNVHGMTVAIALGHGYPALTDCMGFKPKVAPEQVCIVGTKDIDRAELEFLSRIGVKMFTLYDIERYGIVHVLNEACRTITAGTDRIHVSFDVDVLDPVIAPGTGIVSRGGLSYREISYIMQTLGKLDTVSSIDIIEINPLRDVKNQTAELAVELLLNILGGSYGDYERNYLRENKYERGVYLP